MDIFLVMRDSASSRFTGADMVLWGSKGGRIIDSRLVLIKLCCCCCWIKKRRRTEPTTTRTKRLTCMLLRHNSKPYTTLELSFWERKAVEYVE